MGSPSDQIHHGAHGIIRRGGEVLLVKQHPSFWPNPFWSLPGGTGEPGELLHETLLREVAEETGLAIQEAGPLAWLINIVRPTPHPQLLVAYFDVRQWSGDLVVDDPAGVVTDAEFMPVSDAISLLSSDPSPHIVEPAVEYLAERAGAGGAWCYRGLPGESAELAARL